jgi:phage terminase large subunit-like protein
MIDFTDEEKREMIHLFGEDIVAFSKFICSDVVHGEVPEFHQEMYDMVTHNDRVLIAAPRGFSKSCICARIYPLWLACYGLRKDILVISASEGLAIENMRYVKMSLENNELLRELYGDLVSDKWRENHIEVKHHDGTVVTIRAKGAGGQIRGFRPDCLLLDDLETDDGVESEDQRKKLKDWVFKACLNCLLPGGQLVMMGTVLSQLSLLNELLLDGNGWVKKRYTAYVDGVQESGNALWPDARPHEWLQNRKKEIGTARFSAEYMNNPVSDEDAPIKVSQIRYWDELPEGLNCVIATDPAYSEDKKSDYKACALVGVSSNGNRYLIEYIRTHNPMGEYIQAIFSMWQRHREKVTAVGLPSTGIEREFFRSVTNKAQELNIYPPFVELKHTFTTATGGTVRSKLARIKAALQPLFENGKYYIGRMHEEAKEEILTVNNAIHDDLVDCMAYCESLLVPFHFDSNDNGVWHDPDPHGVEAWQQKKLESSSIPGDYGLEY